VFLGNIAARIQIAIILLFSLFFASVFTNFQETDPCIDDFLEWVALKADLNQDDRIHPTRAGYAIVVENLMKVLEKEKLIQK
jgi:lysophospholipase L1-like esterase